jgi:serine/threonine-protein kinase
MPPPAVPQDSMRAALARVLASDTFAGAKRSAKLLEFLVGALLEGRAQYLKEYTLGADGLGRGADFDPRVDPIARVEASRLRGRLELYYATEGAADDAVIVLPKGGYVPQFVPRARESLSRTATSESQLLPVLPPARKIGSRAVLGFASLVVAAAAFGMYLSFAAPWRADVRALQPLVQFDAAIGAPGTIAMHVGSSLAFTPDGEKLVFLVLGADGSTSLFVRRLDELTARSVPGTFGATGAFFFSPDSRWVAFFTEGKLKKTLVEGGGSPITLATVGDMLGGTWGEDGTIVVNLNREPILWSLPENGGTPEPLIDLGDEGVGPRWPQLLPGGRAVLYSAFVGIGSNSSIAVTALDGERSTTLITRGAHARYLPSGHVVYLDRGTLFAVAFDAQTLEMRGEPVPVLRDVASVNEFGFGHYDVSSNGTLAYLRSASSGLATIEWLDGGDATRPLLSEPGRYVWPRLSPDGTQISYTLLEGSDADLWVYDLRTRAKRRITVGGGDQNMAIWTLDGRYLLYSQGAEPAIYARRSDGTGDPKRLLPGLSVPWSLTSDGRRLAYHQMGTDTGFDLWTVPIDAGADDVSVGEPERYRALQTYETYPAFSPDGRYITHGSNESGVFEVYVRAYPDGGHAARISSNGGRISAWAKDGALFYETSDQRLMVVPYRIEDGEFVAETPRLWSTKRLADTGVIANYDVAPDGKSVVAIVSDGGEPTPRDHVTLLMNFQDEVRRRTTP